MRINGTLGCSVKRHVLVEVLLLKFNTAVCDESFSVNPSGAKPEEQRRRSQYSNKQCFSVYIAWYK